jgi:hypothetical protein
MERLLQQYCFEIRMEIVDLAPDYLRYLADETSFEVYKSSNISFFDHYLKFWNSGRSFLPSLSFDDVKLRRELVIKNLAAANDRLRKNGFSTEDVRTILFVGNNSANGHAFLDNGKPIAWFAIECFKSELEAKVFTMHEVIHALHYSARPEFYFTNIEKKNSISRQLITEGIATYITKDLLNLSDEAALWADAIPAEQIHSWMNACRNSEIELLQFVAANFESSDPSIELFYAANPNDIFSYRAGYYVGLKAIESIALDNNYSERDLLKIPFVKMKQIVWDTIQKPEHSSERFP